MRFNLANVFLPGRHRSLATLLVAALLTASLAGCAGGSNAKGKIRVLNVSTGYESVDLYVNNENDDNDSDTSTISSVSSNTVSDYASIDADTYSFKFRRSGVASTLLTEAGQKITDESHTTYVTYGSSGHFGAVQLSEDKDEADAGETTVQIVNAADTGALDIYLTDSSTALTDTSPIMSAAGYGTLNSAGDIDSGTYRLRVTGAGDTTDLRLDVPSITLDSKDVVTLVLTASSGGVLVNAYTLHQQGALTAFLNDKARIRGAMGIASTSGTFATARVGGVTLLSSASAGVIGSRYSQVTAGTSAPTVAIDGTTISVPNVTLTAGADYTLLLWSDSSGIRSTLVSDDNHLPESSSSNAKLRLLNGASGLGVPLTMSIDYSPVAEFIAVGTVSTPEEITSGSEYILDITNSNTTANLLSRSSVSLVTSGVYTMFVSGGGSAAIAGTLRKDR